MGAPTSSLASLVWRPRRTPVFRSPSAEDSSPNRERCCVQDCCGTLIDEWEARLPYSPIGTFSQDTTFVKMIDHSCFKMEVETQVVNRTLQQNHIPDDGEKCPDEPDDLHEFDVWKQKYNLGLDFQEHESSIQITETRERLTCDLPVTQRFYQGSSACPSPAESPRRNAASCGPG